MEIQISQEVMNFKVTKDTTLFTFGISEGLPVGRGWGACSLLVPWKKLEFLPCFLKISSKDVCCSIRNVK